MEYLLKDMTPAAPFRFFEEISAVPRPSGAEDKIADYLCAFAASEGLFCYRDAQHNVLIKKPATKGREGEPPLLLQAHTDMVAEADGDVAHDFTKDPIHLVREGDILRAAGTTLGADNGCGVAMMLAALSEATSHPALECLFTVSEEVGLIGAGSFDYSLISARRMVNLDSDEEKLVIVGCCGGERTDIRLPIRRLAVSNAGLALSVTGLCGGHSGSDIDKGRGNALTLMAAWLNALCTEVDFSLSCLEGGNKDNAIPRACSAKISLSVSDVPRAREVLLRVGEALKKSCTAPEDAALCFSVEGADVTKACDGADTARMLALLSARGGVLAWREDGNGPHTSRNVAAVHTLPTEMQLTLSTRSYAPEEIGAWREEAAALAASVNAAVSYRGAYPGWVSPVRSPLSDAWGRAIAASGGEVPQCIMIHAGLECGLISEHLPGLVAISVGSDIFDLHTPGEHMSLSSFARVYRALLRFLAEC